MEANCGEFDIEIFGPPRVAEVLALLAKTWPKALVERVPLKTEPWAITDLAGIFRTEFFVFATFDMIEDWEVHGATPTNCGSMIHLIADLGMITLVGSGSFAKSICEVIRAKLEAA